MNREEAIKIFQDKLRTMEHGAICCNYGNDKDAFLLAIQALQQEPYEDKYIKEINHLRKYIIKLETQIVEQEASDDAVSRQYLIEKAISWKKHFHDSERYVGLTDIKNAPPVTPQPKTDWIPVSERLPNVASVFRVTRYFPNNVMNPNYLVDACFFDGSNTWYNDNRINHERAYVNNVIAWQEDPEPYEPQESEDKA